MRCNVLLVSVAASHDGFGLGTSAQFGSDDGLLVGDRRVWIGTMQKVLAGRTVVHEAGLALLDQNAELVIA